MLATKHLTSLSCVVTASSICRSINARNQVYSHRLLSLSTSDRSKKLDRYLADNYPRFYKYYKFTINGLDSIEFLFIKKKY